MKRKNDKPVGREVEGTNPYSNPERVPTYCQRHKAVEPCPVCDWQPQKKRKTAPGIITPGPWQAEFRLSEGRDGAWVVVDVNSDNLDVLAIVDDENTRAELGQSAESNAIAIAAVPDLIEALQNIEANLGSTEDHPTERWADSYRRAKQALAKAGISG
jgi:hypothetical protein